MREDTEAPGIDCHLGGTTVAAGPDRDGDGALGNAWRSRAASTSAPSRPSTS